MIPQLDVAELTGKRVKRGAASIGIGIGIGIGVRAGGICESGRRCQTC